MSVATIPRRAECRTKAIAWLPLPILPLAALIVCAAWPRWVLMWSLALSLYAGLKWLSFADHWGPRAAFSSRGSGYLLFWPGMNASAFFARRRRVSRPSPIEWLFAVGKIALGFSLLVLAVAMRAYRPFFAAWTGLVGIAFVLHFGLFHLLSLCWRRAGVDAPPIMNAPIQSTSLVELWGRRWNLAFRDMAHAHVYCPLVGRLGARGAAMATFLISGLVHDFVISLPAGGGFGLPTAYFLVQGLGVWMERSRLGRRLGLGRGSAGRVYCLVVATLPIGLLFHHRFIERVVLPMLSAFGAV